MEWAPEDLQLAELFDLERLADDRFQAVAGAPTRRPLYGGQVAAQALIAAGATVPEGRSPHSLHAYFLRGGRSDLAVDLTVARDRDGRGYSARRVTAEQEGRVILSLSASFAVDDESGSLQDHTSLPVPSVELPDTSERAPFLIDTELGAAPQARPSFGPPTRFWLRCTAELPPGPLLDAAVLLYFSDLSSGHFSVPGSGSMLQTSLDHAMWFHRGAAHGDWVLLDFEPHTISRGRGLYTGTLWAPDGTLAATVAQQTLYRSVAS
ncbi:MAG: putative acyl-CoA thioesterase [Frankiales bacterium]|nr:putative acyl-CoA thioesterase [Frankiales bacterium]